MTAEVVFVLPWLSLVFLRYNFARDCLLPLPFAPSPPRFSVPPAPAAPTD